MRILHDVYTSRAQDGSRSFRPDPMSGCLSKREFTNSCRQAQKRKRVTPWTSRLCSLPLEKLSKSMAHRPSQKTEHRRTRSTYRSLACARPRPTSAHSMAQGQCDHTSGIEPDRSRRSREGSLSADLRSVGEACYHCRILAPQLGKVLLGGRCAITVLKALDVSHHTGRETKPLDPTEKGSSAFQARRLRKPIR